MLALHLPVKQLLWRLEPRRITFPEHDADEWANRNRRTASRDVSIDKHVSQDLADLAPDVQEFIAKLSMSLSSMNDLLLDQLNTEDSNFDVACRWLRANEASWSAWVPEKGKCFSQFGMYSDTCLEVVKAPRCNIGPHLCKYFFNSEAGVLQ